MKKSKIISTGIIFFLILNVILISNLSSLSNLNNISNNNSNLNIKSSAFQLYDLAYPDGSNLEQYRPYDLEATFYDLDDMDKIYNTNASLETQFVGDPDLNFNDTISNLNNLGFTSPTEFSSNLIKGDYNISGTHYKGEESFSGYLDEEIPDNWEQVLGISNYRVKSHILGHSNVLMIGDGLDMGGSAYEFNNNTNECGNVSFWMNYNQVDSLFAFGISSTPFDFDTATNLMALSYSENFFGYYNDTDYSEKLSFAPLSSKWDYYEICYNLTSGMYSVYLNDEILCNGYIGDRNSSMSIKYFTILSIDISPIYIDALDYSWASGYYHGRNMEVEDTTLDQEDEDGLVIESNDSGIYNATFSFEDDIINSQPAGFDYFYSDKCAVTVVDNFAGHSKVVSMNDRYGGEGYRAELNQTFTSQENGTIEFYLADYLENSYQYNDLFINILDSVGTTAMSFHFKEDKDGHYFRTTHADGTTHLFTTTVYEWFHIRIDFECTSNNYMSLGQYNYSVYINEEFKGEFEMITNPSSLDKISFYTSDTGLGFCTSFIDAIGYSWDLDYNIGDNLIVRNTSIDMEYNMMMPNFPNRLSETFLNCSVCLLNSIDSLFNLSIFNYNTLEWQLLFSERGIINSTFEMNEDYILDDNLIRIKIASLNTTCHNILVDVFSFNTIDKLVISFEKTFSYLGLWKYRFHVINESFISDWIYFNVIEHSENFRAVSYSGSVTEWFLSKSDVELQLSKVYDKSFNSLGDWQVGEVIDVDWFDHIYFDEELPQFFEITRECTEDTRIITGNEENWGDLYFMDVGCSSSRNYYSILNFESLEYYDQTPYSSSNLNLYCYSISGDIPYVNLWQYYAFDELVVTGNNFVQPTVLISSDNYINEDEWNALNISTGEKYFCMKGTSYDWHYVDFRTKEYGDGSYSPFIKDYLYQYHINNERLSIQSDESKTISLLTNKFDEEMDLNKNSYMTIDLETSIKNAEVSFYSNSFKVMSRDILENNANNGNQTIEILLDDITFDQILIQGEFDDKDYMLVDSIEIYDYDQTGINEINDIYVSPKSSEEIYLEASNYNLKIYEDGILKIDNTLEIEHDLTSYIYRPMETIECQLKLLDNEGKVINFDNFEITAEITLNSYEKTISLLEDTFIVDKNSNIKFIICDLFGDNIKNETIVAEEFIYIEINMPSLKIVNEASDISKITINKEGSSISIVDLMVSNEINEYRLFSSNYSVQWLNYENNETQTFELSLTEDYILQLPTTYFQVYFSIFNFDGLGLSSDLVRFYINNERKNLGFNTLKQDTNNLKVLDFFNQTLFDENINLRSYTEYNIYIEIWNLIIQNQYQNQTIRIEIERNGIIIEQTIDPQFSINYRFLPEVEYLIRCYDLNDTLLDTKTVILEKNNKIVSFGFYSEEISESPEPFTLNETVMAWTMMIASVGLSVGVIAYTQLKKIPNDIRKPKYKPKLKNKTNYKRKNGYQY